jgi:SAM-dependent methyltransferase
MKNRILNIINTGKLKKPNTPEIVLLIEGLFHGIERRFGNIIMNVRKDSTFTPAVDLKMCSLFPTKVLNIIISELKPKSILDVGCGTGMSLSFFLKNGIDAIGLENSDSAIKNSSVRNYIVKHNLNKTYVSKRMFDLVWCFEVIEHIHPKFEASFLQTLVNHSNNIILSAAKPGQGGHGHFNEQEAEYWISRFNKLGFNPDYEFSQKIQNTGEPYVTNLLYFKKRMS